MHIAIIGAGPIGLEAALSAEAAGHRAVVYDAGRVGESVRQWGHVQLFTPWTMNTTPRGRARIALEPSSHCPTGAELVRDYLGPLAATLDVREHHRLVAAARGHLRKTQEIGGGRRATAPFRLLFEGPAGEVVAEADALFDCSGVLSSPNPAGAGGIAAIGERAATQAGRLHYGIPSPDALPPGPIAVVGAGASGCTVVTTLIDRGETVVWVTGTEAPSFASPADDRLPQRRALWEAAAAARTRVDWRPGVAVERIEPTAGGVLVHLSAGPAVEVRAMVVATGFRPDTTLTRELQVHHCYASEGPMKLAAALLSASGAGGDCLDQPAQGPEVLHNPEPRFFVLGSKSYGRRNDFLLQTGFQQVQDAINLLS